MILAAAAGLAGGLIYAWVLVPVTYTSSSPDALDPQDKMAYLAVIGDLYVSEGDQEWARRRLAQLGVETNGPVLATLIEEYLDTGGPVEEVRNLARLAQDLGASGGVLSVFDLPPNDTEEETEAATKVADTPLPSPSPFFPSPTPAPAFQLIEKTATCAAPGQPGTIVVRVRDTQGTGIAGVEISISWATGEDRFFTGLRPQRGDGYADFEMSPQIEYDVSLARLQSDVARGLSADLEPGVCPTTSVSLDWRVVFQQVR
jgi:hypothetical protein